jgi:hypothetical protein
VDCFGYKYQQYGCDVAGERRGGRRQRNGDDLRGGTLHTAAGDDPGPNSVTITAVTQAVACHYVSSEIVEARASIVLNPSIL